MRWWVNRWHGATIERHSLSFAALSSSLREGAGDKLYHSTGCLRNREVSGDFHRPYESAKDFYFFRSIL